MRGQIRGLDQASRNAQDGISMIQTAEGSLSETHSILQRMKELATQSANDTNVDVDRLEIQKEINQLTSEINRIGNTTEFNTQKLLKGKNVAVTETAAAQTTITAGEAGVAVGDISSLTTAAKSVLGVSSNATVQASTSKATGAVSDVTENTQSIKGVKASVTVPNGITFEAANNGTDINDKTISILQGTTVNSASRLEIDGYGNYTFTIGQTVGGDSLAQTRGSLYNELNSAINNYDATTGFTDSNEITVLQPVNTGEAVTNLHGTGGTFSGGIAEQNGQFQFTISNLFEEAGDTITIEGQTFTAVLTGAVASKGEFNIGAIEATLTGGEAYDPTADLNAGPLNPDAKVDIVVGGTTYTMDESLLDDFTGGTFSEASVIAQVGAATDGTNNLSTVADISFSSGKLVITAKDPQTSPITWTASSSTAANVATINNAFGMNTVASITGGGAADLTEDLNGRAAVWNSGAITNIADGTSNTLAFMGVTVTLNGANGAPVAAAATNSTTASVTVDTSLVAGALTEAIADALVSAYGAARDHNDGDLTDNESYGFTFERVGAGGAATLRITGPLSAGDDNNAQAMVKAGAGAFAIAEDGSSATAAGNTAGTDTIDASTNVVITIDGTDYTISNSDLKNNLNSDSGAYDINDVMSVLNNAKDSNGHTLSEVATVSQNAATLTIVSQNLHPTSEVTVSYNSDVAGDMTRLATIFNITNYSTDTGADAFSSSSTLIDQAKSLAAAIEANSELGERFQYATTSAGQITLNETNNQATGVVLSDPVVSGAGADDKLLIANTGGQNLNTVTITRAEVETASNATSVIQSGGQQLLITATDSGYRANGVKVAVAENSSDNLNVKFKDGVLTINLADTTLAKNSSSAIQTAIRALETIDGIDFSTWTAADQGTWDANVDSGNIQIKNATFSGAVEAITENQLNVTVEDGNLTIHLSAQSARDNTAAKIQKEVQDIGEFYYFDDAGSWTSIDFSKYEFATQGNWDTATLGNNITKGTDTLVGGTEAVKGEYTFNIAKAFAEGDKIEIKGQVFTAVTSDAVASNGEFNISGGNLSSQAASLIDAINLNTTLKNSYIASASGTKITLTESQATGTDLVQSNLNVRATGTQGEYSVSL